MPRTEDQNWESEVDQTEVDPLPNSPQLNVVSKDFIDEVAADAKIAIKEKKSASAILDTVLQSLNTGKNLVKGLLG